MSTLDEGAGRCSVNRLVRRFSCLRDAWRNEWRDLRFDWWKIWRWHRYAEGILSEYRHQWRLENYSDAAELERLTTAHRWLMLECDGWRARAEHAEKRIKQLIKHRGHVAAEAVMDKMEQEFSSANKQIC